MTAGRGISAAIAVAMLAGCAACGSSGGHEHSVAEVERAFAASGVALKLSDLESETRQYGAHVLLSRNRGAGAPFAVAVFDSRGGAADAYSHHERAFGSHVRVTLRDNVVLVVYEEAGPARLPAAEERRLRRVLARLDASK